MWRVNSNCLKVINEWLLITNDHVSSMTMINYHLFVNIVYTYNMAQ